MVHRRIWGGPTRALRLARPPLGGSCRPQCNHPARYVIYLEVYIYTQYRVRFFLHLLLRGKRSRSLDFSPLLMPVYQLLCQLKPHVVGTDKVFKVMKVLGLMVHESGGILTSLKSFGAVPTAYTIKRRGLKTNELYMFQMEYASEPKLLNDLNQAMKYDDDIVRYQFLRKDRPKLPTTKWVDMKQAVTSLQMKSKQ